METVCNILKAAVKQQNKKKTHYKLFLIYIKKTNQTMAQSGFYFMPL